MRSRRCDDHACAAYGRAVRSESDAFDRCSTAMAPLQEGYAAGLEALGPDCADLTAAAASA